jgi:stearoyl-CoA desaturase (delta-9 desaturase)
VQVRRLAPTPLIKDEAQVGLDTVEAVILNRLHVLRHYGRSVIVPAYKQEKRGACAMRNRLLAGTRKLMIRERALLKPTEERRLRLALARSQALDTVYGFRLKLEKLWDDNAQSNDRLLHAFKEWCHEAEASGVASLQEFATHLRSYSMQPQPA